MRWEGMWHVWGRAEIHSRCWWVNTKEIDHLADLGVDGSITLEWILKKKGGRMWNRFMWLSAGQGQVAGCCEHGNEHSVSIKRWDFVHYVRNHKLWRRNLLHGLTFPVKRFDDERNINSLRSLHDTERHSYDSGSTFTPGGVRCTGLEQELWNETGERRRQQT